MNPLVITLLIFFLIIIGIIAIVLVLESPFKYPYYYIPLDVSGRRQPDINDLIDEHLNKYGLTEFYTHQKYVDQWKATSLERIQSSFLQKYRQKQFQAVIDDEHMFCFQLIRQQTRYSQRNYVRTPYTVYTNTTSYSCNLNQLVSRYNLLSGIGFECTLSEYFSKEQRKLMTKDLREKIAQRDNYTCQICGKYMPDGVGLHIDHIIPISKGGKSVPSNLQVLCSKCNGRKSSN